MSGFNSRCPIVIVVLALTVIITSSIQADIPHKINYQGKLVDSVTGEAEVGSHSMAFRIYDDPGAGTLLWSESQTVSADSAGIFSVILGSITPIDVSFDGPVWLEVEVGGETLLPRREMVSVPFAFQAEEAGHSLNADSLGGFGPDVFVRVGQASVITSEMITDGTGSGLDADLLDGLNADSFADSGHAHDDRYCLQDSLSSPGTVNEGSNPVDWTRLKNVPAGFADGLDEGGGAGDGHSLDAVDGDPTDVIYVDAEGRVGVGTLSPGEKLEVDGSVDLAEHLKIGGNTVLSVDGSSNTLLGVGAGPSNTGDRNTFVGTSAGGANAGGYGNTCLGAQTGASTVLGLYNTFVGSQAGSVNDMGLYNTLVGAGAGYEATGSFNTFIGNAAGYRNEGDHNIFLGYQAGYGETGSDKLYIANGQHEYNVLIYGDFTAGRVGIGTTSPGEALDVAGEINTSIGFKIDQQMVLSTPGTTSVHVGVGVAAASSGDRNTLVGYLAGRDNTTGDHNVSVGNLAGLENTTGGSNTFVGSTAGKFNEDGGSNTYIGSHAGLSTVDGSFNTIVGSQAGWMNDMGGYNTLIGAGAGAEATGTSNVFVGNASGMRNEGNYNVFLGSLAGYHENGSNKLYIANGADTSDVLIYGDFATGKVGIGMADPKATLTVNANLGNMGPLSPSIVIGNPDGNTAFAMGSTSYDYCDLQWIHPDRLDIRSTGYMRLISSGGRLILDADGEVGIGEEHPEEKLHILGVNPRILIEAATSNPEINFKSTGDPSAEVWALYKESSNDDLYFLQDGTIRVALKNGTSALGIGTNNVGTYELYVQGEAYATGGWTPSDLRFKEEIGGIESPLEKVLGLRGVRFKWKTEQYGDRGFPEGEHYGVIAQDAEKVLPEIVKEGPGGEKAIAYAEIIPVLIESVRELKAENDVLRERIAALEVGLN